MKFKRVLIFLLLSFMLIQCSNEPDIIKIFMAGDSTMSIKRDEKRPETGWGEKFPLFLAEDVEVINKARNGRSTRTFISEGRWQTIIDSLQEGNYVFIQFGHNDQSKQKVDRYTPPADYKKNLEKFVTDVRAKKGIPVLLTPVMRRRFDENGKFYDVHGVYPGLVREVAKEMNVFLVDHHKSSEKLFVELGEEGTKELFLKLQPGENPNYPDGVDDNTHFNDFGAKVVAELVAKEISESDIPLKKAIVLKAAK